MFAHWVGGFIDRIIGHGIEWVATQERLFTSMFYTSISPYQEIQIQYSPLAQILTIAAQTTYIEIAGYC